MTYKFNQTEEIEPEFFNEVDPSFIESIKKLIILTNFNAAFELVLEKLTEKREGDPSMSTIDDDDLWDMAFSLTNKFRPTQSEETGMQLGNL